MSTHSVENHLRLTVQEYDKIIRTLVPHYDELLETGIELLEQLVGPKALILDIGGGTGRLSEAVLNQMLEARVELIDIDPKILEQAKQRFLGDEKSRIQFKLGSFFDPLAKCDAAVASLSLHHISDLNEKTKVYKNIFNALKPGGLFLCLDASMSDDTRLSKRTFAAWAEHMVANDISIEDAHDYFKAWQNEEHYFSLHEEFAALIAGGFKKPECFWRRGPMAIYGALKDES